MKKQGPSIRRADKLEQRGPNSCMPALQTFSIILSWRETTGQLGIRSWHSCYGDDVDENSTFKDKRH